MITHRTICRRTAFVAALSLAASFAPVLLSMLLPCPMAFAQDKPTAQATPQSRQQESEAAYTAAVRAAKSGPTTIPLLMQAKLNLPQGYIYVPVAEAARMMRAFGNTTGPAFLGVIMPAVDANWFATLNFQNVGYVKDDDAKTWKADELLQNLKDGAEAGNAERQERGFPAIEVGGWIDPPVYSSETHRLVWSANVRDKGEQGLGSVNYNTYALGRDGYISLNMVGAGDVIVKERARGQELLAALVYVPGKNYTDFQPSTDRVAEYGLAALIGAGVAKKLGLLALIGGFFAKFALVFVKLGKLAIVAVIGVLAAVRGIFVKLFGNKSPPPGV